VESMGSLVVFHSAHSRRDWVAQTGILSVLQEIG